MAHIEKISKLQLVPAGAEHTIDLATIYLDEIPEKNNYNPRDFRTPSATISPYMAYFNLLRTILGPGVVGMPVAMSASGLTLGTIFTITIGIIMLHTHHMLLANLNEISRQLRIPYISYRYGFRLALLHGPPIWHCIGHHGPAIIATFMFLSQLGLCTVNVIMTADSLRDIVDCDNVVPPLISLYPCYLLLDFFMKSLKRISYVTLFATFLNTSGLILLLYHIFKDPIKNVVWHEAHLGGWLFTTGMCMFNFSAVGVVLALDHALKQPVVMTERWGVINVALGIPTVISLLVGVLGYWAFGTMEENCLRSLPYEDFSSMVTIAVYLISMALSYPLQCYPAIAMLLEVIKYRDATPPTPATLKLIEVIARPTFVTITFLIAYQVPFQGPFVAFVGNLCTSMMSVVFPVMMDIGLRYNVPGGYGKYKIYLIKDLLIILGGVICLIFGAYFCAVLIHIRILSANSPNKNVYF